MSDQVSKCYEHPAYNEDACVDCAINHLYGNELFTTEVVGETEEAKPMKYQIRKSEWKKKLERIESYGGKHARTLFLDLVF